MARNNRIYSFSFTAASMKFHDFINLARYIDEHQIDISNHVPDPNLIMRGSNTRTNQRVFRELIKRYKFLTLAERKLLFELDIQGQKQLALIAICKTYSFIQEFIVEVIRDKFMSLDLQVTDGDYQSFINRKVDLHPELEYFSESTTKKARQVTFKIMEQGGLFDNAQDKNIIPQFVNGRIMEVLRNANPGLLKILLVPDHEIKELVV